MKNKFMSACLVTLALLIVGPLSANERIAERAHHQLVVFGDSLSDPGNYYAAYHEVSLRPFAPIPDAPYVIGGMHFSNGATWVEQLGRELDAGNSSGPALRHLGGTNFAVGRARARAGAAGFPYYDLATQVGLFLGQAGNRAPPEALYVVWIGANDLKDALESLAVDSSFATAGAIIQQAVGATAGNLQALWAAGARHFLLVDMPDLGYTPYVAGLGPVALYAATQLTAAYNGGLAQVVAALGALPGIDIKRFDINATLQGVALNPAASGIADFTTPCLRFAVVVNAVCGNADQHMFWDAIHPTRAGHELIAEAALETLGGH
ncbi:MAG: SGNH/GDSL hydrolase family protein [Steroidobacteraceae bacterium]